jgi:predicted RND superfamily exporter protein
MSKLLQIPVRWPKLVCLGVFACTLIAVGSIIDFSEGKTRLRIDPSFDAILPDDDPARVYYDHAVDLFGDDQSLILAVVMDDVFTVENLERVRRISDLLEDAEGVDRVVSLATANHVSGEGDAIEIAPFLEDLPTTRGEAEKIRAEVRGNPVYGGNLVSRDDRVTAFIVFVDDTPEQEFTSLGLDREMLAIAEEHAGGGEVLISGTASMRSEISRILRTDMSSMLPAVAAIMALIAFVTFRSPRGVLLPLVTILVAAIWTFGVVAWVDIPLNLVTTILPVLLLTVGFAYSVHVISDYYEALRADAGEVAEAGGPVAWALDHVSAPLLLTVLTTVVGFLSLTLSDFPAVRQFGLISVFGIVATAVLALTFAPAVLSLLAPPDPAGQGAERGADANETSEDDQPRASSKPGPLDAALDLLAGANVRFRSFILAAGVAVAVLALWGIGQIVVDTHLVTNFDSDHPVRANFEAINDHLEGARPISIVIESEDEDAFLDSYHLRAVSSLQRWVENQPEVGGTTSFADYLRLLNRAFNDEDPNALVIPHDSALINQLMLIFGGNDDLPDYVSGDYAAVHIHVRSTAQTTREISELADRIEERMVKLPEGLHGRVTGNTVVLARSINAIAGGQIESLSIAMLFIFVLLSVLFVSFRIGFIALVPNVLPLLLFFGVLGITGVPLNATTGLIACVVLGIAVDDTIHFLTRFNACARREADEKAGAEIALREVFRPVTTTSVALFLGFLVFTTGVLRNQTEFGALAAGVLAFAWLVDLTFTPALCSGLRIVTIADILTLDLGDRPQDLIPAFKGMNLGEVRIVALLTNLVSYKDGESVLREGDVGRHLFVVMEGELAVSITDAQGRRSEFGRMKRGDIIGEVGLYYGQRTADVVSVGPCRLLRLDHEGLERLHRRYPRTGRRLAWNLSAIMAERLARATQRGNAHAPEVSEIA